MSIQDVNVKGGKKYRYRVYYYDKEAKKERQKCSKYYDSYNDAREAEIEFLYGLTHDSEDKAPTWRREKDLTFHVVYMQWFDWSVTGQSLAFRTIEDKQRIVEIYFPKLLPMNIEDITVQDIQECFSAPRFTKLSTDRKNRILDTLKSIFKFGRTYLKVYNNPTEYFRTFKKTSKEHLKEVQILEPNEFRRFSDNVSEYKKDYWALFYVLYWTGMRLNEANSLTFKDVYDHKIHIYRQWDEDRGEFTTLKTRNAKRDIDIDPITEKVIQDQKLRYSTFKDFSEDWFIFGGTRTLPYTNIEREKNKACQKAGVPKVKIHSFRHAHASYLLNHGVPMFLVSRRLGHSSINMTADLYGHIVSNESDDIIEAIMKNKA